MSSSSHLRSRRVPCRIAAGIRPLASQYLTVDAGAFSFSATCETVNSMSLAYGFCHTAVNMPTGPKKRVPMALDTYLPYTGIGIDLHVPIGDVGSCIENEAA